MSKAFTKEADAPEDDGEAESTTPTAPGGKNYMTPGGARRLREELYHLKHRERPEVCAVVQWAAENGDRSENADYQYGKKRLREIDRRLRFLAKRLDSAEIVDPTTIPTKDQVLFGATVDIRDEDGNEKTYSIVGIDESNIEQRRISWISPIANALFKAHVGDIVTFRSPKGPRELEILAIRYVELP